MVRHPKCGKSWRQRGNRTGHCARCCETLEGLTLFDAHQRLRADGRVECVDPATLKDHGQLLRLVDGTWRGGGMGLEAVSRVARPSSTQVASGACHDGFPDRTDTHDVVEGVDHG